MTPEEFEGAVFRIMREATTMTVATCAEQVPWATDVYFSPDGFDLVFFSSPDSRHCRNLAINPVCAATIHTAAASWQEIRGLQMEGICEQVTSIAGKLKASQTYFKKFPFARSLVSNPVKATSIFSKASAHIFRPYYLRLVDNQRGLGVRFYINLENGRPVGPPEREVTA